MNNIVDFIYFMFSLVLYKYKDVFKKIEKKSKEMCIFRIHA